MMDKELKREILMDHYANPNNKVDDFDNENYKKIHNASESCIDDITVYMYALDNKIIDVKFSGIACTIATASTDIMIDLIIDKSFDEAKKTINEYLKMLNEEIYDEDRLEEANAFDTLFQQANRIKCGLIGIKTIKELIDEYEK